MQFKLKTLLIAVLLVALILGMAGHMKYRRQLLEPILFAKILDEDMITIEEYVREHYHFQDFEIVGLANRNPEKPSKIYFSITKYGNYKGASPSKILLRKMGLDYVRPASERPDNHVTYSIEGMRWDGWNTAKVNLRIDADLSPGKVFHYARIENASYRYENGEWKLYEADPMGIAYSFPYKTSPKKAEAAY